MSSITIKYYITQFFNIGNTGKKFTAFKFTLTIIKKYKKNQCQCSCQCG